MKNILILAFLLVTGETFANTTEPAKELRPKLLDLFYLEKTTGDSEVEVHDQGKKSLEEIPQKVYNAFDDFNTEQQNNTWSLYRAAVAQNITDPNQLIYIIATAIGSSQMEPTREQRAPIGSQARRIQDEYWYSGFYGRGYAPEAIHGNSTYTNFSRALGVDLSNYPDRLLTPDIAAELLVYGMKNGNFTGRRLSDYFNSTKSDFLAARNIIVLNDTRKSDYSDIAKVIQKGEASDQGGYGLQDSQTVTNLTALVLSNYFNSERKNFNDFLLTKTGTNYTVYNGNGDYPFYFTENADYDAVMYFYYNPVDLKDTSNFYEYPDNDPKLGPVDKLAYSDVIKKGKWYGPYTLPKTSEFYFVSLLESGANEYYAEIKLSVQVDKYNKQLLTEVKLSFKRGKSAIAPPLACRRK